MCYEHLDATTTNCPKCQLGFFTSFGDELVQFHQYIGEFYDRRRFRNPKHFILVPPFHHRLKAVLLRIPGQLFPR